LTASEIAYRNESALSEREQVLLRQWGYPYVKELYQFHFTLSDGLDTSSALEIHELTQAAKAWFDFVQPLRFDRIALFVEESKGQDFQFLTDFVIPQ
jgi:Mn-dependent DtxR family transcriptional regulator